MVKDILAKHNLHDLGTDRLPGSLMEFMPENMNHHKEEPWTTKNGTEGVFVGGERTRYFQEGKSEDTLSMFFNYVFFFIDL